MLNGGIVSESPCKVDGVENFNRLVRNGLEMQAKFYPSYRSTRCFDVEFNVFQAESGIDVIVR